MNPWEGAARWINTILLIIVGFLGFRTLFELLGAQQSNAIVRFVESVAGFFLAPFEGMFPDQDFLLTFLIAILGYCLLAGIALAITRSLQASAPAARRRRAYGRAEPEPEYDHHEWRRDTSDEEADRTTRLDR